jgi:hypothetical protein
LASEPIGNTKKSKTFDQVVQPPLRSFHTEDRDEAHDEPP